MSRHLVIFNPASGRGRGARRIADYRALLSDALDDVTFVQSEYPGHEADLAEEAIQEGFDVIVAAGGDGTWSHVADRILKVGVEGVALGLLPNGTGNDFGRSLGYHPTRQRDAVRVLAADHRRRVDVGRLETPCAPERDSGDPAPRHFLNLLGFGFDIAVIDAARDARFLKGELLYKVTALQQLFRYPGFDVTVEADGVAPRTGHHLMLTVSNGCFFGGGFPIAPGATLNDGLLHTCRIADAGAFTRLKLFQLAERGRHVRTPQVELLDAAEVTLNFPEPPRFEVDGDVFVASEEVLQARVIPRALEVVAPPESTGAPTQ